MVNFNFGFGTVANGAVPVLPDPVPAHPLLDGKEEIGRGQYSVVLDKGDGERVYKVVSSPADYWLHTATDRPQGKHFPIVYADHGDIGQAQSGYRFCLLEMERLYPLTPESQAAIVAAQLSKAYWEGCRRWSQLGARMGRMAMYHLTQGDQPFGDGPMQSALRALSEFIEEYQLLPDILKADNLMVRKDGTLVFSDPVFVS